MAARKSISQSKRTAKPKALSSDNSPMTLGQLVPEGTQANQLDFPRFNGSDGHQTGEDRSCL